MPRCPGCASHIHPTEILCHRCYNQDFTSRWPKCQVCFTYDACGEAAYELCIHCHVKQSEARHEAAAKIQRLFREAVVKYMAATKIQAVWRGYSTRLGFICPPKMCEICRLDIATMINEYGDYEDVCADCFWDIREAWRHESYFQRLVEREKLIH